MDFRTEVRLTESKNRIDFKDSMITIGSCFSDDIGMKLRDNKFEVNKNPFGTVYNPLSIHALLRSSLNDNVPRENGYLKRDEAWFHYDFHSVWHGSTKEDLQTRLVEVLKSVKADLQSCKYLIITYGTSWVYEQKETKEVVANCHKISQNHFEKRLLTQKKIIESFEHLYSALKRLNKELKIILTVSPVRHIKDTLELNSVSKSVLRISCHTLTEAYPDVEYFPSYEIMMDDLRDYRFYKSDLIHPSEVAVDYIWEKFCQTYFDQATIEFIGEWSKIRSALAHKPFQPNSPAHQQFLRATLRQLNRLSATVDVREEIDYIQQQILN